MICPHPVLTEWFPYLRGTSVRRSKNLDYKLNLPVLDLLCHGQESLLDICRILRRGLKEWDRKLVGKFLQRQREINIIRQDCLNYERTFATPYSTTFLLVKSDLLPTSSLFTPSEA
jgi:hypothetical protein